MLRLVRPLQLSRKRSRLPVATAVSGHDDCCLRRQRYVPFHGAAGPRPMSRSHLGGFLWFHPCLYSRKHSRRGFLGAIYPGNPFSTESGVSKPHGAVLERLRALDDQHQEGYHQLWTETISNQQEDPETTCQLAEALLERFVGANNEDPQAVAGLAESIIHDLEAEYQATKDPRFQESRTKCYEHLISFWSITVGNPQQAEQTFWKLLAATTAAKQQNHSGLVTKSLNKVLQCWATSGNTESGVQVDRILSKVSSKRTTQKGRGAKPFPAVDPNPETCHLVNVAWQNAVGGIDNIQQQRLFSSKDYLTAAKRVQGNVDFMWQRANNSKEKDVDASEWIPQPDVYHWLIRVYALARAHDRAQSILDRLIASAQQQHAEQAEMSRLPLPTTAMYNDVLRAMSHLGKGYEASLILSKWVSLCQTRNATMHDDQASELSSTTTPTAGWCQPDETSCLLVIHAWGRFADHRRAPKAETILNRMLELERQHRQDNPHLQVLPSPTVEIYNAVIRAWSISRHYKIATPIAQVERLLSDMNKYRRTLKYNPCAPNMQTYELALETLARFGYKLGDRKRRMQKVIREIKGHRRMEPSARCLELLELCEQDEAFKLEG